MAWKDVGEWLKKFGGPGLSLVGELAAGPAGWPAAIATASSMISSATGHSDPVEALKALQEDPQTRMRLAELAQQNEESIRNNLRDMRALELKDKQAEHEQAQLTIRSGDTSQDEYVRHTRPMMARQSWYATAAYLLALEVARIAGYGDGGPTIEVAALLSAPAWAYLGLRTADKFGGLRSIAKSVAGK